MALTAEQRSFIETVGFMATADMKTSRILASLTIAQAILESNWGNSGLTVKANALFGIKAGSSWRGKVYSAQTQECYDGAKFTTITALFRAYGSWNESVADHSALLTGLSIYKAVIGEMDYKKACQSIYAAGYATDPSYPSKLINIIELYDLAQYDKEEKTMFTNTGLVAFAKKALNENWGYCLGSFGNVLTESFLAQKCNQGGGVGTYNTSHKDYLKKFMNRRVSDCYGLVKGYAWWNDGKVQYNSNGCADRNQEGAYNAAKEKGPIVSMPEIPGLVLWMKGHAGIYIGNGEFIECAGAPIGMRKGKIANGQVVSGSKFTHWFKDTYIAYEEAVRVEEPKYEAAEAAIDLICVKCGFVSPDYWKGLLKDVPYFLEFVTGIAGKLS